MKKILIIGGSGFLGSHVADYFTKKKYDVTIFDQTKSTHLKKKQRFILSNLKNFKSLEKAIKSSDVVYHFAAMSDIGECISKPYESAEINISSTLKILNYCVKYKIKRLVFASTIYVHSDQGGFYRITKQAAEQYIEEYNKRFNLNYTILRFGTVYGLRSGKKNNLTRIINEAYSRRILKYYGGTDKAVRRYIHISDATKASYNILKNKFKNKNVLITGTKKIKITKVMKFLSQMLKINTKPIYEKKTENGHYDITPYTKKKKPEIKYSFRHSIDIKKGLTELVKKLKPKSYLNLDK